MDRVSNNTQQQYNRSIDYELERSVDQYAHADRRAITNRIHELDKEWDIERVLETNMPAVALSGIALGAFVNKKWLALPAVVLGFFLQHAVQGWCPPLPLFRKLGFRTRKEIEKERYALKFLRGDFTSGKTGKETFRQNPDGLVGAINA